MKKTIPLLAVTVLAACGGGNPTQSTAPEPAATPAATVTAPAAVSAPGGVSVTFGRSAAFVATNTTDGFQLLEAYITSFDDQAKPIAPKRTARVEAGAAWADSFEIGCVQLDVAYAGGKIIAFAYFDKEGKQFGPGTNPERIAACRPQPTPTPKPLQCTYTIDCGKQDGPIGTSTRANYCVNHSAGAECAAGHGVYTAQGQKCVTPFPGTSNRRWQLTPGQSAAGCLKKD